MQLVTILNKANVAYLDGFLSEYYDENTGDMKNGSGDSLARFIVAEISETFVASSSDADQLKEARRVLLNGIEDLQGVVTALNELLQVHGSPRLRGELLTRPLTT
jgi:hypothetical protein